ncbi:unnamed protein product [Musa hybrid cultivar]
MALIVDCHQMAGDLRAQSLKEERKRNHHCAHGLNFEMLAMSIRSSCLTKERLMGTAFATLNCFLILLVTEMFGFTDLMHTVLLLIQVDGSTPSDQIMKSLMFWKLLHVKLLHSVLRNKHGSSPHSAGSSSVKGFISWRWSSSNPLTSHLLEDPSPENSAFV